jgi:hypothetical protein
MPPDSLKLLLSDLEAEVVAEALELYLYARPAPTDLRFEYRYRAARAVQETLRHRPGNGKELPASDDGLVSVAVREIDAKGNRKSIED